MSNFENGRTLIAINHFLGLLQNINVNAFEFQNVYNHHLSSIDSLLFSTEVSNALISRDVSKLNQIVKKLEQQMTCEPNHSLNKKLRLDYIRCKSILSVVDKTHSISIEEIKYLEQYLFKLKEWGQYDIALLGQCAQHLTMVNLMELTQSMISPFQINIEIPYVKQAQIQTLLNIINVFVEKKAFSYANKLIKYLENSNIHDYYMFEKLTLIYNKANCDYKNGNKETLQTMAKCQEILEFCDCSKTATWIASEIAHINE